MSKSPVPTSPSGEMVPCLAAWPRLGGVSNGDDFRRFAAGDLSQFEAGGKLFVSTLILEVRLTPALPFAAE